MPKKGHFRPSSEGEIRNEMTFPIGSGQKNAGNRRKKPTSHKMVLQDGTQPSKIRDFSVEITIKGKRRNLPTNPSADQSCNRAWLHSESPNPLPQIIIDIIVRAIPRRT